MTHEHSTTLVDKTEQKQPLTYKKYEGDGTRFVLFGYSFEPGTPNEYAVLCELYRCSPGDFVRPIAGLTDPSGRYIGYEMEYVDGTPLAWADLKREDAEHLREIVGRIHAAGLAHGDLNLQNVLRLSDGSLKIIDPVGYNLGNPEHIATLQEYDTKKCDELSELCSREELVNEASA